MEEIKIINELEIRTAMSSTEENIRKAYEATKKGCIESLKKLMEEDPYIIQKVVGFSSNNNETHPLLHLSISNGYLEFTRLLLHHNPQLAVEVDSFQRTPLHLASKLGDVEIVQALLEKNMSACFVYDNNGLIPLHYAVISGQMDIMQELIKASPRSLWMKLKNGQTVLHLCVENNNLEGMKLLIETYVNDDEDFLNITDDNGNTILDLSMTFRQSEMVRYIVLSIEDIKTRRSIRASNGTKESLNSGKTTETKNPERNKKKFALSWSTKNKRGGYKGDWDEEVQGTMMLVATVIATVTFQAGMNPPGGVWQQDTKFNSSIILNSNYPWRYSFYGSLDNSTVLFPGTAIFAYQSSVRYLLYSIVNMVSFLASVSVILLIISGFPLKNRVGSGLLVLAMCVAVVFLAFGYLQGTAMVNSYMLDHFGLADGYYAASRFMMCLVTLVVLFHVTRFLAWVVQTLYCIFTSKLKSHTTP